MANVNFFSRVHAGADGALEYAVGHGKPGAYVELRAEMDTLVVLNTAPHPLESGARVRAAARWSSRSGAPSPCARTITASAFGPRTRAAYANTAIYNCQLDQLDIESRRMSAPRLVASTLDPDAAARREIVTAGSAWLAELERGQTLRIVDLEGNQAVDTLFYSLARPTEERYSALDDDPRAGATST